MSNIKDFVDKYYVFAMQTQAKCGISAIAILSQAALESAWGRVAPGNMFFGVKDNDGINGNEQLLTTTEYMNKPDAKFPQVLSVTEVILNGKRLWKYKVKDWFRKYKTPEECFSEHAQFFFKYKRYAKALEVKSDPYAFFREIAAAGYATDPSYASKLTHIGKLIEAQLPKPA